MFEAGLEAYEFLLLRCCRLVGQKGDLYTRQRRGGHTWRALATELINESAFSPATLRACVETVHRQPD